MMMKSVKQLSDILALLIWIRKLIGRPTFLQTSLPENGTMGKRGFFFHLVYPRNVIPVITGDNGGSKLNNCCSQDEIARP